MQVFAIPTLPALFVAISVGKIMMHTQEILFVQAFKTDLKRIFYHRKSSPESFVRADIPAGDSNRSSGFHLQHPQAQILTGVGFSISAASMFFKTRWLSCGCNVRPKAEPRWRASPSRSTRSVVVALTAFAAAGTTANQHWFVTVQWSPESRSGAVPYNRLPPADNQSRHAASVAQYASADRHGRSREYRADFAGTLPASVHALLTNFTRHQFMPSASAASDPCCL